MKILVTGAAGMLGGELVPVLQMKHDVIAADLKEFDITDVGACREFVIGCEPDLLINCAAYTDVDGCEENQELAFRVNGKAPRYLASASREAKAWMIHLSTDYIFDGTAKHPYKEDQPHNPLSVYGKSKWAGENEVRKNLDESAYVIFRTAWLYGTNGKNFVEAILSLADTKDFLTVVDDQRGSPTHAVDLAWMLQAVIDADVRGVFHGVNTGEVTWCEYAKKILQMAGIEKEVRPMTTAELNRPAHRPAYSVLSTDKLTEKTGHIPRDWAEALAHYFEIR